MAKKTSTGVGDYTLRDPQGPVQLSGLFCKSDLLVVLHNMGTSCPNCTLWGDEFNGMRKTLEKATSFCIVGPDEPKAQAIYAKKRGWSSRFVSAKGTSFIKDMGFEGKAGDPQPGVSVLKRTKSGISIVKQVNVMRDGDCPSVLEVIWMLPGVKPADMAWK